MSNLMIVPNSVAGFVQLDCLACGVRGCGMKCFINKEAVRYPSSDDETNMDFGGYGSGGSSSSKETTPASTDSELEDSPGSEKYFVLEVDCGASGDFPRILSILSDILEKVVSRNDSHPSSSIISHVPPASGMPNVTIFHGLRPPTISVGKYLQRIFKYINCSHSCFVAAYVYIDRLLQRHKSLVISSFNIHRLLITSIMVAAKFLDDSYFDNAYYGKVGGVSTLEMNRLELEFLFLLDFKLFVSPHEFASYCEILEKEFNECFTPVKYLI